MMTPCLSQDYASRSSSIIVLSVTEYLNKFYPDLHELHELYQSIAASRAAMTSEAIEYPRYLSLQELKQGRVSYKHGGIPHYWVILYRDAM